MVLLIELVSATQLRGHTASFAVHPLTKLKGLFFTGENRFLLFVSAVHPAKNVSYGRDGHRFGPGNCCFSPTSNIGSGGVEVKESMSRIRRLAKPLKESNFSPALLTEELH
jgi:hypothetical protein